MRRVESKYEKNISGTGEVALGTKSFTIDLTYKTEKGTEKEEKYTFKFDDLPDNLPDGWRPKAGKEYFASISADGKNLRYFRPARGSYSVMCENLAETGDGDYLIIEKKGDWGPYTQFVALLTVQDGPNAGIDYPQYLPLWSESHGDFLNLDEDSGEMYVSGNPTKSFPAKNLFDFTGCAVDDTVIKYPMNDDEPNNDPQALLEALHKGLKKAKKRFTLLVENGYPKSMAPLDDDDDDLIIRESPDEEDEPADEPEPDDEAEEKPKDKKKKPKWDED